jgi:Gas vesicle protein
MAPDQPVLRYSGQPSAIRPDSTNLADLLERILDKGIVIAGDIAINLVDIELLTIKLRLLIASVDKAREIGINWWESDPWLSRRQDDQLSAGSDANGGALSDRLDRLEAAIERLQIGSGSEAGTQSTQTTKPTRSGGVKQ